MTQIQESRPARARGSHWLITPTANATSTSYTSATVDSAPGTLAARGAIQNTAAESAMEPTANTLAIGGKGMAWSAGSPRFGTTR